MKLWFLVLSFIVNAAFIESLKVLSSYGCYSLLGKLPRMSVLSRSITPINVHEYNQDDVSIVCISLVKGAEFKSNQNEAIIDLSNNAHGISLVLPKSEILSGLYGSSLEPIIISSCKKAKVLLSSPPNTKLMLLQPFVVFSCIEVVKQQISIPQTKPEKPQTILPQVDYLSLGSGIPFGKRPYECRFDSPTFAKEGSSINYKKKQVYWTCFSKVEELLVINLFSENNISEKVLLSIVDDMRSIPNKISVKSPCNGTMHENKQGILNKNQVFLRIECEEENLPKLLISRDLGLRQTQLRKK
ncbi:uncharacterized protein ELE39_001667 [Cryptosporidium sp. chipmunk genotype I]|uniref:uncharacterized protein n=1 Tax=Cryptosporidium sp. chipmunk genotype I TaxID=1280935 RepID=UPI00351A6522|nr:hypothetical protein ELE39_001667 [Cryptosporidium sp. chipmunk genotype I]